MLLKCCTQYANKFGKINSGQRTGKGQFSFQSQRKEMPMKLSKKQSSNHPIIAFISHAIQVVLKILQASLQQYVNRDLPDVQAGFRKGREKRLNCQHQLGQI